MVKGLNEDLEQGRNLGNTLQYARTRLLQTVLSHTDRAHLAEDASEPACIRWRTR